MEKMKVQSLAESVTKRRAARPARLTELVLGKAKKADQPNQAT